MSVSEDIVIVVISLLHFLGEKHEFFLVLTFVATGISHLFEAAVLSPVIAERITNTRRKQAVEEARNRIVEELTQTNERAYFLHYLRRIEFGIVRRHQSVTMCQIDGLVLKC